VGPRTRTRLLFENKCKEWPKIYMVGSQNGLMITHSFQNLRLKDGRGYNLQSRIIFLFFVSNFPFTNQAEGGGSCGTPPSTCRQCVHVCALSSVYYILACRKEL
jgi:hypothetical protein